MKERRMSVVKSYLFNIFIILCFFLCEDMGLIKPLPGELYYKTEEREVLGRQVIISVAR
jgi:hypothetical protein